MILTAFWVAALVLSTFSPGVVPTASWLVLLTVGLIVGIVWRVLPLRGSLLTLGLIALLVSGASLVGGALKSLGVWTVTLTLGAAAVLALALRSRLRRAVTIPNILISGGLGVLVGLIAAIVVEAQARPTVESAAANTGESLVWAPFALLLASPAALAVFAVAYLVILNGRASRQRSQSLRGPVARP